MTDNPTGTENAQIQDDAERAHDKAIDVINAAFSDPSGSILHGHIVDALREAEQRGMLRGASIALGFQNNNRDSITSSLARCIAEQIKAVAERAATPEAEG